MAGRRHSFRALPARLQQPAGRATLPFVRLLRRGELVRSYAKAGKQDKPSSLLLVQRGRSASRFVVTSLVTLLSSRLQRGTEGQECSWRVRAASAEQDARNLLQRRQRRVALERLRDRCGAGLADIVAHQAAAKVEGQGCSGRDRAAGTEQGARNLRELRQRRIALERLRERRGARAK
jgi:hypothetical protein